MQANDAFIGRKLMMVTPVSSQPPLSMMEKARQVEDLGVEEKMLSRNGGDHESEQINQAHAVRFPFPISAISVM